jgi:O-methyltransferase
MKNKENNQISYLELLRIERKKLLDLLRETRFTQLDKTIVHKQIIPSASYSPWESDKEFSKIYKSVKNNTLIDIYRCYELWSLVNQAIFLEGDILEVGVWRGGSAVVMGVANKNSKHSHMYLADTFKGVVKAGKYDTLFKGGEYADTSERMVNNLMKRMGIVNFKTLRGVFPNDFQKPNIIKKLKVCHIDVDTYESAKDVFEYAWPIMVSKGIIIFDDYSAWGCEGVTKYVNTIKVEDGVFIHNLNGHALIIKI